MKRRILGSSLIDYVLPTALIGVTLGMAMFYTHDSGNLMQFIEHSLPGGYVDEQGELNFGIGVDTTGGLAEAPDIDIIIQAGPNEEGEGENDEIGEVSGIDAGNGGEDIDISIF